MGYQRGMFFSAIIFVLFISVHNYSIVGDRQNDEETSHNIAKRAAKSIWDFPEKISTVQVDLVVILDRSLGIGQDWFYARELKVVQALLQQFALIHEDYLRIALLSFGRDWSVDYDGISNSSDAVDKCTFFNHPGIWRNLTFINTEEIAAGTNIKGALGGTKEILIQGIKNRPGIKQLVLVLSDGDYGGHEDPYKSATYIKDLPQQPLIFTIGIGHWEKPGNVRTLASDDGYYAFYNTWVAMTQNLTVGGTVGEKYIKWTSVEGYLCDLSCEQNNSACFCDVATGYYRCRCNPGYTQTSPELECQACELHSYKEVHGNNECSPCLPNRVTQSNGSTSHTDCTCSKTAQECQDPCEQIACSNTTKCVVNASGKAECECDQGWMGANCDVHDIFNCTRDNPCQNEARCVPRYNDFICICPYSKTGRYCETEINECRDDLCLNNATCVDLDADFKCACLPFYEGNYCQDYRPKITTPRPTSPTPTTPQPTKKSTTEKTTDRPTPKPTERATPATAETNLLIIVVPAAVGGALLIFIVGIVCVVLVRRRRKDENDKVPHIVAPPPELTATFDKPFGSPAAPQMRRPDLLANMNGLDVEAVNLVDEVYYDNTEIHVGGLSGWGGYLGELMKANIVKKACVTTMDAVKKAPTSTFNFNMKEIYKMNEILDSKQEDTGISIQGSEFFIFTNDGSIADGRTMASVEEPEVVCFGKTKTYLVLAIADLATDSGGCRKEVEWITEHILSEGY